MAVVMEISIDPISMTSQGCEDSSILFSGSLPDTIDLHDHMVVIGTIIHVAITGSRITMSL